MEKQVEVLVVGGGPAGISCAFTLGKAGVSTIIVDKKSHDKIGDKVCGDALHPKNTEEVNKWVGLPKPDKENGEVKGEIEFLHIEGSTPGTFFEFPDHTRTIDRHLYGQHLLRETEKFESVEVIPDFRLMEVIVEEGFVKGVRGTRKQEPYEIRAKVVVDASGAGAVVRKKLPDEMCTKFPKKIPLEEILVSYREIIRTPEPHNFQKGMYLVYDAEMEKVMPGYYWVFTRGEKEANVGLGYFKRPENIGIDIRAMNERITRKHFQNYEVIDGRGGSIPARLPLHSLVHNGFLAVGDAGALVNPINGEGHGPALFAGVKAGQFIIEALEKGDYSEKGLWGYNKWIWNFFGSKHAMGIAIIKFMDKVGFQAFDYLMSKKIIDDEDIKKQLGHPNAKPKGLFIKIIRLLPRPRILLALYKMLKLEKDIRLLSLKYPDIEGFEEWKEKMLKLENTNF